MENWWWEGKIFPAAESGGRYLVGKAVRSTSAQPVLSCLTPVCSYATRERGMRYCVSSIGVPGHCQPYIAGLMQYAMVFTRVVTKAAHIHLGRHSKSKIYIFHQPAKEGLASEQYTYIVIGMDSFRETANYIEYIRCLKGKNREYSE